MPAIARADILTKFRDMVARKVPIVGGGAGTGLSAKSEEAGGIDLIIIYNSGRYRMAGRGSAAGLLAYGNANEIVKEMAVEVLPVVKNTPVLAGVNGTDPFILMPQFLARAEGDGVLGRAELSDDRPLRRQHAAELRRDRDELSARGRDDRRGAQAGSADDALCVQPRRVAADDRGRRRHHRCAYGRDDRRRDRRQGGEDAGPVRERDRRDCGCGARGAQRHHRPLPRRSDLDAGGCEVHPRTVAALPRVLRRELDGAAAGRDGDQDSRSRISRRCRIRGA